MKIFKIGEKYIVTSDGRVFTYWENHKKWKEQKYRRHTNGYLRVTIFGKGEYVHRLVAQCFIENPNDYPEVNHKDGNKENNSIENLEWCTRSQNNKHAFQTGLRSYEELKAMAQLAGQNSRERRKLTEEQVKIIRSSSQSDSALAKMFDCARVTIYKIRKFEIYKDVI